MFYNVNKETGSLLSKSRKKAETQDSAILNFFKEFRKQDFNAHEVCEGFGFEVWPIHSVRRSINTLHNAGKIKDTGKMRLGGWGKNNRVYKFKKS